MDNLVKHQSKQKENLVTLKHRKILNLRWFNSKEPLKIKVFISTNLMLTKEIR